MASRNTDIDASASDRYRSLFENSDDAILIIENDIFVDCNQAAVNMLRYRDKDSLMRLHPSELSPEYQPDGRRSYEKANEILDEIVHGGSKRFEWTHKRADGSLLPVEVSMTVIPGDESYTLHVVWRDNSERVRLEKELRHAQKMEALGNLAGGIAHDFNNALVPIVIYSDLLISALEDGVELKEWAHEISRAAVLATSQVKKLVSVSRKADHAPVTLDLGKTVADVLRLLEQVIGEDIELLFQCSQESLWVEIDPGDVEHALLNLASNARDALPSGGRIDLTLSAVKSAGQPYAQLEFADNGNGMDAETLENVFSPFFTTKKLGSGTGLGMSSVYHVVSKANGHVDADSTVGEGSTITLKFPLVEKKESETESETATGVTNHERMSIDGVAVLLVEDDDVILRLIRDMLSEAGCEVFTASNGNKALSILEASEIELVITDVVMPEMGGPQLATEMTERGLGIPVIFLSGYTDDRLIRHELDPQSVVLLRKPFTARQLLSQVKQTLAGSAGEQANKSKDRNT